MSKRQDKKKSKTITPSSTLASLPKEPTMDTNEQALSELTETNKLLHEQLSAFQTEVTDLRALLNTTEERMVKAQEDAEEYKKLKTDAVTELKATRENAKKREEELKEKSLAKMKEIRQDAEKEKNALVNKYAAEVTDLQQQLQNLKDKKGKQNMSDKQIETLNKEIETLKQQLNTEKQGKEAMSKEVENLKKEIEQLKNDLKEARDINNSTEEAKQEIESLKAKLNEATKDSSEAKTELDKAKSELIEVTKWNSKHTMKVAGAVVGMIILVAGVAYVVRRVLANGEAEVEAVDSVDTGAELSVVNY